MCTKVKMQCIYLPWHALHPDSLILCWLKEGTGCPRVLLVLVSPGCTSHAASRDALEIIMNKRCCHGKSVGCMRLSCLLLLNELL